ncbi:MAG: hypothetical protein FWG20_00215 [Candidatus Cloacimonetes bacterium]|nr:hypothetical protein [Candidatus Cloacimonadota bacterium]
MEAIQMLQRNIEIIQNDIRVIHTKLDETNRRLIEIESQKYRCTRENDLRYIKLCEFERFFKIEHENIQNKRLEKLSKSSEFIKNILAIMNSISPLAISFLAYLVLKG